MNEAYLAMAFCQLSKVTGKKQAACLLADSPQTALNPLPTLGASFNQ